ncbi:MAG: hypothetical protein ABIF10_02910 [Candidatus Woesearchaeota archaeon]
MDFTNRLFEYIKDYLEMQLASENVGACQEEILKSVEEQQGSVEGHNGVDILEKKPRIAPYYLPARYYPVPKQEDYFFVYAPGGITLIRVPQSQIGHGVLGVAYPGKKLIMIADHLQGLDFEEVKKHEILHILYPNLTEQEVRQRTRIELPFDTRYN